MERKDNCGTFSDAIDALEYSRELLRDSGIDSHKAILVGLNHAISLLRAVQTQKAEGKNG